MEIRNTLINGKRLEIELEPETLEIDLEDLLSDMDSGELLEHMDEDAVRDFVLGNSNAEQLLDAMDNSSKQDMLRAVLYHFDNAAIVEQLNIARRVELAAACGVAAPTFAVQQTEAADVQELSVEGRRIGYVIRIPGGEYELLLGLGRGWKARDWDAMVMLIEALLPRLIADPSKATQEAA